MSVSGLSHKLLVWFGFLPFFITFFSHAWRGVAGIETWWIYYAGSVMDLHRQPFTGNKNIVIMSKEKIQYGFFISWTRSVKRKIIKSAVGLKKWEFGKSAAVNAKIMHNFQIYTLKKNKSKIYKMLLNFLAMSEYSSIAN
jgi:hypothetical protein